MWQKMLQPLRPVQRKDLVELVATGPDILPWPVLAVVFFILESQIPSQTGVYRSFDGELQSLDSLLGNSDE